MESDLMEARKAVAMLLGYAVQDYEKDDKCIEAVDFAINVLRKRPNDNTIEAMNERREVTNRKYSLDDFVNRM